MDLRTGRAKAAAKAGPTVTDATGTASAKAGIDPLVSSTSQDLLVNLGDNAYGGGAPNLIGAPDWSFAASFTPKSTGVRESITFTANSVLGDPPIVIKLVAPDGANLTVGTYLDANVTPSGPQIEIPNTACSPAGGWFEILEMTVTSGVVTKFAGRARRTCEGVPTTRVEMRYHSLVPWKGLTTAIPEFPWPHIGETAPTTVTLTASGTASVVLGSATLVADPSISIDIDGCSGHTLAPGVSCTVTLKFSPVSLVAIWTGHLDIVNDTVDGPIAIPIVARTGVDMNLTISGLGAGSVQTNLTPCASSCTRVYPYLSTIVVKALPASGSAFDGWSGACTGLVATCNKSANAATITIGAVFSPGRLMTVTRTGPGSVTSSPAGINCGVDCSELFPNTRTVTLTATPSAGAQFIGWGGACTGTASTCILGMSVARTVSVRFDEAWAPTATVSGSPGIRSTGGYGGVGDDTFRCRIRPCAEPPDPWIAVGPNHVIQATNDGMRIYNRAGVLLRNYFLWDLFLEPYDQVIDGDARVIYDAAHGRWIASEMSANCTTGLAYLAVSAGADPTGAWDVWAWPGAGFADYPGLGISSDKVVLSFDRFGIDQTHCATTSRVDSKLIVVQLSSLLAGVSSPPTNGLTPFPDMLSPRPARTVGTGSDVWLVGGLDTGSTSPDVVAARLTGVPSNGSTALMKIDLSGVGLSNLTTTAGLQRLTDPTGMPLGLAGFLDGRATDAVAFGGAVWFVANNRCVPTGDSVSRACVRVVKIAPTGVVQNFTIGAAGKSTFGGGIGLSTNGTLFLAFAQAGADGKISTFVSQQRTTDAANSIRTSARLSTNGTAYAGTRWGDYVGIAPDPVDSTAVWQANQLGVGAGWGTLISKLASGSAAPSGSVSINGGATATTDPRVSISVSIPAGAQVTEMLVSNSPTLSSGKLASALRRPAGTLSDWSLTSPTYGGSNATGVRSVYVQFGTGADTWSAPIADTITFSSQKIRRLAGTDRYATAAAVSAATFTPGIEVAYVSSGTTFNDPLVAAAAAGWLRGPLLLVTSTSIPAATAAELTRLKPRYIVVVGSPASIPDSVGIALAGYSMSGFAVRQTGADRNATAATVSRNSFYESGAPVAFIAYGGNFPDALAAAAAAGKLAGPVLYTDTNTLPSATRTELSRLKPVKIYVVGGTSVISSTVASALAPYASSGSVVRLAGADRYATAVAVSKAAFAPGVDVVYIAYGLNFPDALAGAAAAGFRGGPVLLTPTATLNAATAAELTRLKPKRIVVLGSTGVISSTVYNLLAAYATGP